MNCLLWLTFLSFVYLNDGADNRKLVPYKEEVSVLKDKTEYYSVCVHYSWEWKWKWFLHWEKSWWCSQTEVRSKVYYYWTTEIQTKYRYVCIEGWSGGSCDIPICNSCRPGETCVAPNKCECKQTGGACSVVACSETISCYPGTCLSDYCSCPPNFKDSDCLTIRQTPEIESCTFKFHGNRKELGSGDCAPVGLNAQDVWFNSEGLETISMIANIKSPTIFNLPDSSHARFVKIPTPLGISNACFLILKNNATIKEECNNEISSDNPVSSLKLEKAMRIESLGTSFSHNDVITVTTTTGLGGHKMGVNVLSIANSHFPKKTYTGASTSRTSSFKIDLLPPKHCFNDEDPCDVFPIYLERDITTNPEIKPKFIGWEDDGSGIHLFNVKVFLLRSNTEKQLENVGNPVRNEMIEPKDINNFVQICTIPGVYSIELTVYDKANNSAKARNIFIYIAGGKLETNEKKLVTVKGALSSTEDKEFWINDIKVIKANKQLLVSWSDRFIGDVRFNEEWSYAVKPWSPSEGIDDVQKGNFSVGKRKIEPFNDLQNGIAQFTFEYAIDEETGGLKSYDHHERLFPNKTSYNIDYESLKDGAADYESLKDGVAVPFTLSAEDALGHVLEETYVIKVDTSPPTVEKSSLVMNYPDQYSSRIAIVVQDDHSGIKIINYTLRDTLLKTVIREGGAMISKRDAPNLNEKVSKRHISETYQGPCTKDDDTCYCTPDRKCFNITQSIDIDHCWIDRITDHKFELSFFACNYAGLCSSSRSIKLEFNEKNQCRPRLTTAQMTAIILCCLIGFVMMSAILALLVRIYLFKKPAPLFMSQTFSNVRNRFSRYKSDPITSANELYISGDEEFGQGKKTNYGNKTIYNKEGEVKLLDKSSSIKFLSQDDVKVNDELSKGSFVIVSKGMFNDGGNKVPVAVKFLKNGASHKNIAMMNAKAELLASLPFHENLVKVFGLVKASNGHTIVMELCEPTLKSWLSDVDKITTDVLDEMLMFTINIARAVEHLHKNKIIHKRLAIRNVLLTKQFNQYIAKLIGFGGSSHDGEEKASVPLKWLAPETLTTIGKKSPVYSEHSDAWSYGITLWEIYTLGKSQPYPDYGSREAKEKVISGLKMERPEECPPDLYSNVMKACWDVEPSSRPSFTEICKRIEDFRKGEDPQQSQGYYTN